MQPNRRHTDPHSLIAELEARIARLAVSPVFGCYTRAGIDDVLAGMDLADRLLVYFDVDDMKGANAQYGKAGVNVKIAAALRTKRSNDAIIGQWFSGDEFVAFPLAADAYGYAQRLQQAFAREGLGITVAIRPLADGIEAATIEADEAITRAKLAGNKGVILWDKS